MFGLGAPELIIILVVLLIFFGKDRLPELARSIGKSLRELKAGFAEPTDADKAAKDDKEKIAGESKK